MSDRPAVFDGVLKSLPTKIDTIVIDEIQKLPGDVECFIFSQDRLERKLAALPLFHYESGFKKYLRWDKVS